MAGIPINSGTGPEVAADLVGTDNYQIVKIMQGASGVTQGLGNILTVTAAGVVPITGTVGISVTTLTATTGTFSITGTVAISGTNTALQGGNWNIATVSTVLGVVAVSGGGGGFQYGQSTTGFATTGTGTVLFGIQSTTAFAVGITGSNQMLVSVANQPIITFSSTQPVTASGVTIASVATGTFSMSGTGNVTVAGSVAISGTNTALQGGSWNIATVTTLLGVVSVSGGGGGVQYGAGTTGMGSTGTGNIIIGMQSGATTGRAMIIDTTGGLIIASMPSVGGGQQYVVGSTNMGTTGTGTLVLAMQSGSTAGQTLAVTTTGAQYVLFTTTQAVTAANVTVASVTTGTFTMSGTGNVTIAGTPSITGNVVLVTTAKGIAGGMVATGHASQFQAYVLATTSAAGGVIIKTSGASTLYVTDMLVSTPSAMNVGIYSETTGPLAFVYLASNGGWAQSFTQPLICSSAQSLRCILSSSGTCSITAIGYTVT